MKGITLCADCAYYNMMKHKCTRGCKIDPDVSKGENPGFYVDCPLPDVEPLQKWIPCSERLPEEETDVIAVIDGCSREAFYSDNSFIGSNFYRNAEDVTYWMMKPEPPKEDDND